MGRGNQAWAVVPDRQRWVSGKGIRRCQAITLIHQVTILSRCKLASVLPDFLLTQDSLWLNSPEHPSMWPLLLLLTSHFLPHPPGFNKAALI